METKMIEKNGFRLHLIKSNKFKTVFIKTVFWHKIKNEELTIRNLLFNNLLFSSKNYSTNKEFSKKKADLYGLDLGSTSYRRGPYVITEMFMSVISDKYTESGLINNAFNFYCDTLFNPNVANCSFDKTSFDIVYNKLESSILMDKEHPGIYSALEYRKLLGNPYYAFPLLGDLEILKSITATSLYEYYKNFFNDNYIDVLVVGDINFSEMEKIIDKYFVVNGKKHIKGDIYLEYSKEFSEDKISSSFNQSRLIMGGSLKNIPISDRKYNLSVFNTIFGNSPNSKLFKNVREKLSYAYMIFSIFNNLDGLFYITAGISKDNYEKVKSEVYNEIKNMQEGKFTIKDVETAKTVLLSVLKEFDDSQMDILDLYYSNLYFDIDDVETQKKQIKEITKEDIIRIAKKINIDTILLVEEE